MSAPRPSSRFDRFDQTERLVHWSTAALMLACIATALPLYVPSLAGVVGRRVLLVNIHVYCGLCLPLPVLLGAARRRWGTRLRADLARLNAWSEDDRRWLRHWGRHPTLDPGKFNGGQKANASFVGGSVIVMVMTGAIMKWFGPFPLSWRTGATFVHDVTFFAILGVVIGHVGYALRYPATLRGMIGGSVDADWAWEHAPAWAREMSGESSVGTASGTEAESSFGAASAKGAELSIGADER